jgi:hypothetical protein
MLQQRLARDVIAVLGDVLGIGPFDHCDAGVVERSHQPNRHVEQERTHDAGVAQAVHRHFIRIETDGGDDLANLTMITLTRIVTPGVAVALQQKRRVVGTTPLFGIANFGRTG